MELKHSFTVPTSIDQAWEVLRDIERVGPCMPGATIEEVRGEEFSGRVKVKVGPMQVTYRGDAAFTEVDEDQYRAVIEAKGKEARGSGTANATITAQLTERGDETDVDVVTDLAITGRPAQFGRGVMSDVGEKLLGQFADCLAGQLTGPEPEAEAPAEAVVPGTPQAAPAESTAAETEGTPAFARMGVEEPEEEEGAAIDLFSVAGPTLVKRLGPVVGVVLLVLLIWLIRRG